MAGRRQFGAIRQLPSGRWQARYRDPLTNRLRAAPSTFKTKGDAGRWLASVEANGFPVVASNMPGWAKIRLGDYADEWVANRPIRPRTGELYRSQLRRHIKPHLGDAIVAKLQPRHVRAWCSELTRGPLAQPTVAKVYRLLRSILNTAVEDGLLASNPCRIKGGGVERSRERPIPTIDEMRLLADGMPDRLAATVWVAALAGLRKGEVLGLARRHINLEVGTILVDRSLQEVSGQGAVFAELKTESSYRSVAMPRALIEILTDHLDRHVADDPESLLFVNRFGRPIRASAWTNAWEDARSSAELPTVRFHDLRHLAGTLAAQAGATLKETMSRLGHSSSRAALRYQHVVGDRAKVIAGQIENLL